MLSSPRLGQRVQVWYAARYRDVMPWHGRIGAVTARGTGRPRSHGVMIDNTLVVVPAGNLRKAER